MGYITQRIAKLVLLLSILLLLSLKSILKISHLILRSSDRPTVTILTISCLQFEIFKLFSHGEQIILGPTPSCRIDW